MTQKKKGIPENQDPKKPRKTKTLVGPYKNRKAKTRDPSGILQKTGKPGPRTLQKT